MRWTEKSSSGACYAFSCLSQPKVISILDRLKKVQGKKKRDTEAAEALRRAQLEEEGEQESKIEEPDDDTGNADLLSSKDQDVIF